MQGSYINILMIVFLFGFMYFMIIRPQSKREIIEVGTLTVKLRIAPKVEIELDRNAIRSLVSK